LSPRGRERTIAHVALVVSAFFFGTTFVVVKDAVRDVGPVPFLTVRFGIGALAVGLVARRRPVTPGWVRAGAMSGVALTLGYVFQTIGLQYTTTTRSALITYLLLPLVPVLSAFALRRPPAGTTIAGIALALVGLFLLNGATLVFGKGDALTLGCAVAFAVQIVMLAELSPKHDSHRLNFVQLAVVAAGCLVPGFFLGGYDFTFQAWWAAAYTGIAASAVAFGCMVWAQQWVGPSRTALLLMLEAVFAAVAGYLVGDRLGAQGIAGALLIVAGILVAELGPRAHARPGREAAAGEAAARQSDATRA
jgi:drug/metabolite transporter (DMT)-like permease